MEFMGSSQLLELPLDVLTSLMKKLDYQDLLAVAATCHDLHTLANSDVLWIALCETWENEITLGDWRCRAQSAKALFRLLNSFASLIGPWNNKDLLPKGALVLIAWGNYSLVGLSLDTTKGLFTKPVFEVLGKPDGSSSVELVSATSDLRVSANFGWSTSSKNEFRLEIEATAHGSTGGENLAHGGFLLGPDPSREEHELPMTIGRLAREYIISLASVAGYNRGETALNCTRFCYEKVVVESSMPGRELSGLWTGIYGPHGMEVISVSYADKFITSTKVTGDPNVPSKEITFVASLASESTHISPSVRGVAAMLVDSGYRPALDIIKVYKGKGRVAGHNFHNPSWVKGLLLVDRNGTICFMWESVNFIISFRRLNLSMALGNGSQQVLP